MLLQLCVVAGKQVARSWICCCDAAGNRLKPQGETTKENSYQTATIDLGQGQLSPQHIVHTDS